MGSVRVPLKTPFKTALRTVDAVEDTLVCVTAFGGLAGWGEAPPTAAITGETNASIKAAILGHIRPALLGKDLDSFEEVQAALHGAIVGNTSAKAAVDMALYDLFAQSCNQPLYRLLGGARSELETDLTISLNEPQQTLPAAAAVSFSPRSDISPVNINSRAIRRSFSRTKPSTVGRSSAPPTV